MRISTRTRDGSAHHQRRPGRPRAVEPRQHRSIPPRPGDAGRGRSGCDRSPIASAVTARSLPPRSMDLTKACHSIRRPAPPAKIQRPPADHAVPAPGEGAPPPETACRNRRPPSPVPWRFDLSDLLAEPAPQAASIASPLPLVCHGRCSHSTRVFRGMRDESNRASSEEAAAEQYRLALTYHEMGMFEMRSKRSKARRARRGSGSTLRRCSARVPGAQGYHPRDRVAERAAERRRHPEAGRALATTIRRHAGIGGRADSRPGGLRRARIQNRAVIATWPATLNGCPRSRHEASVCSGGCCSLPCCSNQGCCSC